MSTGQPYRGINVFLLALTAADEGYTSPFWGTYRQIGSLGGQVRRGEHSTLVVFFKQHHPFDNSKGGTHRQDPYREMVFGVGDPGTALEPAILAQSGRVTERAGP